MLKIGAAIGLGALVLSMFGLPTSAEPVRMLQTVVVDVGTDGTINRMEVIDLTRGEGSGDESRDERGLDPSARASGLPVSVQTSYRTGDAVGVDLEDVAGSEDPLTVSVNVTNQTGRVETIEVTDRFTGDAVKEEVVVTTPLTVILSAVLPGDLGAAVDRSGTNASISRRGGDTLVQWGAVLAPPAVQGTATFDLQLRGGSEFEWKDVSLTVEQGVRSDFSVDRVVEEVFGGRAQADDGATIDTTETVTDRLGEIAAALRGINANLREDAATSGRELVTTLATSTDEIKGQVDGLRTEVAALLTQYESQATGQMTAASTTLASRVDEFIGRIGFTVGADGQLRPYPTPRDAASADTVTEIVGLVQELLIDGDPNDADTIVDLRTKLGQVVGEGADADCVGDPMPLLCEIDDLEQRFTTQTNETVAEVTTALGIDQQTGSTPIPAARAALSRATDEATDVRTDLLDIDGEVATVVDRLSEIGTGVGDTAVELQATEEDLDGIHAALIDVSTQLDVAGAEITEARNGLANARDGTVGGTESIAGRLADAENARGLLTEAVVELAVHLCDVPAGLIAELEAAGVVQPDEVDDAQTVIDAAIADVRDRLAQVDCGTDEVTAGLTSLLTLVESIDLGAIQSAADATVEQIDAVAADLDEASAAIDGADTQIDEIAGSVAEARDAITAAHEGLASDADDDSIIDLIDRAKLALDHADPDTKGVRQHIAELRTGIGTPGDVADRPTLFGALTGVGGAVTALEEAARTALDELQESLNELASDKRQNLDEATAAFLDEADRSLRSLRDQLGTIYGTLAEPTVGLSEDAAQTGRDLAGIADELRRTVDDLTGRTEASLTETSERLDAASRAVYLNLTGSAVPDTSQSGLGGGGYQGLLREHLASIDAEGVDLGTTMDATRGFSGVRHSRYIARLVRQAQQQAGVARLDTGTPFDGTVEEGSVVGTVFVYLLEEVG